MNKLFYTVACVLVFSASVANAGILSNLVGGNSYYNNGYYYPSNVRYTNGYYNPNPYYNSRTYYNNSGYYQPRYSVPYNVNRGYYAPPCPHDYYRQPVIFRSKVNRKSSVDTSEKLVANQFSGIEKLENQILLQTYEYDSAKNRIERLEQKLFGASQEGDLTQRFETLKHVARNYKAYNPNYAYQNNYATNNYSRPIFTGGSGAGWKSTLLGNFKNQFVGMPTGITPAMDPAYMDWFEVERAMAGNGEEVGVQTNRGYYYSNTNRGSRTGVTILD